MIGGQLAGRDPQESDVEPLTWSMWEHSRQLNVLDAFSALMRLQGVARAVVAFMSSFDAVLTPALGLRPVPIGEIHGRGPDPWGNYQRSAGFTPYTATLNVTGQPAVSVPLYHGEDGLPTAVQLIGSPAREDVLLALFGPARGRPAVERERRPYPAGVRAGRGQVARCAPLVGTLAGALVVAGCGGRGRPRPRDCPRDR